MDDVEVGDGAVVRRATNDQQVIIRAGSSIGVDQVARAIQYTVSPNGILVIVKGDLLELGCNDGQRRVKHDSVSVDAESTN